MKLLKYGLPFAALALLASCSNDNVVENNQPGVFDNLKDAYFSVSISQAVSTRTATGNQSNEDPQDEEKEIKNVYLVFAKEGTILAVSDAATPEYQNDGKTLKQVFKVQQGDVTNLSGKSDVSVYVVCNKGNITLSGNLQQTLSLSSQDDKTYWGGTDGANGFLMSNANTVTIQTQLPSDWTSYTESNPYPITEPIQVQRAMARFDVYPTMPNDDNSIVNGIKVTMTDIAMVNLSKNFFLFKESGVTGNFSIATQETSSNYVNDPKASDKEGLTNLDQCFYLPSTSVPTSWTSLGSLDKDDATGWEEGFNGNDPAEEELDGRTYKIWKYATPSTITNSEKQLNGNTTGIVFKAELTNKGDAIDGWGTDPMIAYNNKIYGNLSTVINTVKTANSQETYNLANAFNSIAKTEETPTIEEVKANANFKVFNPTNGQYFAHYYYWNRHNAKYDSKNDGEMGIMEFGVVRNNVYKLAVTKITGLGLPDDETPDPETPDDPKPDEDGYFSVEVVVLPWDVRVNDIEF